MSRPLPRYREDTDPQKLDRIIGPDHDTPTNPKLGHRTSPADTRRLRAIPVIAPAIGGTIPGTNPAAAYETKERNRRRFKHHRIGRS